MRGTLDATVHVPLHHHCQVPINSGELATTAWLSGALVLLALACTSAYNVNKCYGILYIWE